jgi:hypothetical protein
MSQDKSATWVYVTFSDGITYRFRAEIVARSRAPLKSWITEWEDASVPDMDRMNQALNKMLRKLTNQGLLSSDGKPFGGIKLLRSVNDTWLLYLYSQFDTAALTEAILEGRA